MLPLLYHPNQWIINALVHFVSILANHLSVIDLNCKILPAMKTYLCPPHPCLTNKLLTLHSIKACLSRTIYDVLIHAKDNETLVSFFDILKLVQCTEKRKEIFLENAIYKRLHAENLSKDFEEQVILMRELVLKISRNKRNYISLIKNKELTNCIVCKNYDAIKSREIVLHNSLIIQDNLVSSCNQEWQHMFGPNSKNIIEATSDMTAQDVKEVDYSLFECPPQSRNVRLMLQHKKNNFNIFYPITFTLSPPFKPRGHLVSHVHEHKSSINQLVRYGDSSHFLSCSDDGTIRLWDVCNDESRYVINRSKHQFRMEFTNGTPIVFKGIICCGNYIITNTSDSLINIFEVTDCCITFLCSFKVGSVKSTVPIFITSICALSDRLFAVSVTDSTVFGYDTRYLNTEKFCIPIFKIRMPSVQRTIMSTDGSEMILFAATSCGYIAGFDLRFFLKVNYFTYDDPVRVGKIKYSPNGLFSSGILPKFS